MLKITRKNIVDEISCISEIRKKFYKTILEQKYEKILKYADITQNELEKIKRKYK